MQVHIFENINKKNRTSIGDCLDYLITDIKCYYRKYYTLNILYIFSYHVHFM